jgi:glycosyltransferase involved in cell wall biosynthesis
MPGVELQLVSSPSAVLKALASSPQDAIHICQGFRGNGRIGVAQSLMRRYGMRYFVVMETVDQRGFFGWLKPLLYRYYIFRASSALRGVFAIGHKTSSWLVECGLPKNFAFPFAYFLATHPGPSELVSSKRRKSVFRIVFAGRLVDLKRLDLLFSALAHLQSRRAFDFELDVIGDGPLREQLMAYANRLLGPLVNWHGQLSMTDCRRRILQADCLVLPSDHDGWGAVVSEALMAGTPAICSDACGAAEAVVGSMEGGVFQAGDSAQLEELLLRVADALDKGLVDRERLRRWGWRLGSEAGAQYLMEVLDHLDGQVSRPVPPWTQV